MATEHQTTQEEKAYGRLLNKETLSKAARTVLLEAELAASAAHMVHSYCFQWPTEYEEAMDKIRFAAAELTDSDRRLLAKVWRAALAAAASIDADDYETLTGYRVYRGDLHRYYRMLSRMVEEILQEKRLAELRQEILESEPLDDSDIPF